jgi:signal peptidase I
VPLQQKNLLIVTADPASEAGGARVALVADVLRQFGQARIRVTGSSMLPSVWPGDELAIRGCSPSETRTGDVVVFTRGERLFAHRVVACEAGCLVTQGDGVPSPDGPVTESELLGLVVDVVRHGRHAGMPTLLGSGGRLLAALVRRFPVVGSVLQRGYAVLGRFKVPCPESEPRRSSAEA